MLYIYMWKDIYKSVWYEQVPYVFPIAFPVILRHLVLEQFWVTPSLMFEPSI